MQRVIVSVVVVALFSFSAAAQKKKDQPPNFDDMFGAPADKNSAVDKMKKATEGVGGAKTAGDGLAPKTGAIDADAKIQLINVFAAERINQDKKLGCQPSGRDKKKLAFWTFDEVPAKGAPFEVCLTIAGQAGREMNMSIAIVDTRNQRVAKAEDVIDFRGRTKLDHVLAYPAPVFKTSGQYFYVVDLDGKEVGRLPLFVVNVQADTSGVPGIKPTDAPSSAPVTASEPDGT